MSLTDKDLLAIRVIVQEEVKALEGKMEALENDVKDIYGMLKRLFKKAKMAMN